MPRLSPAVFTLSCVAAMAATPAAANPGAFVASYGSDANTATSCTQANPCRTFSAAHSVVDPNGLILALDGAGYGIVTITKNVTIAASPGFHARMGNSVGTLVTIATPGVSVTLRGLSLEGAGASHGVNMTNGARLSIENCVIQNFTTTGVSVTTAATVRIIDSVVRGSGLDGIVFGGGATADVVNTKAVGNGQVGIHVLGDVAGTTTTAAVSNSIASGNLVGMAANSFEAGGTATARLSVTHSTASNNTNAGLLAFTSPGPALVTVGNSMATGNGIGLQNSGGTLRSLGNNIVDQNGTNTSGTITPLSGV